MSSADIKPLDGGWGWMVVVGAHISIGFAYATPKVLSVFFRDIQDNFEASYSEIAWISSIMLAAMYAGGPVSSVLVKRFGSRPMVMLGGLMCGSSMVAASFGSSIVFLYLCIGVIGGCGLSLNLNASLTMISKYFLVKRPLANGLAMAGSPVFQCVLAPINQLLLLHFGWRGSFLILGGLTLNCCVAGALMRPVNPPCVTPSCVTPSCPPPKEVEEQPKKSDTKQTGGCAGSQAFWDLTFIKDRGFIIYLLGNMMFIFGAYGPIMFLTAYAISLDYEEKSAYLLSIMGFLDMFARPGTGLIASSEWVRPRIQYFFGLAMVFNGVCHLLCPLSQSYTFLVIYSAFYGISFGMVFALIFESLMDLMGSEQFPSAVGLVTIIECVPMLLGPPTAGLLVDITGQYKYLFIMCGAVIATGGLFLLVMNIYNYYTLEREEPADDTKQEQKAAESQQQVSAPGQTAPGQTAPGQTAPGQTCPGSGGTSPEAKGGTPKEKERV